MSSTLELGTGSISTVGVSRSPILTTDHHEGAPGLVHGYELTFSDSGGLFDAFVDSDETASTNEVLGHTVLTLGVDRVVGDAVAFVRFARHQVLDGTPMVLPAGQSCILMGADCWERGELEPILDRCRAYASEGYKIGLAGFAYRPGLEPLLGVVDYVCLDVSRSSEAQLKIVMGMIGRHGPAVIATGVDDEQQRDIVARAGADYVQGFYFSTPNIVSGRELPGNKLAYLQLLRAAYSPDVKFEELAETIKQDVALSYKLLRYVNSAAFGLRGEVTSLQKALTMLGLTQVRSWVSVATVSGIVHPGSEELAVLCATRARFAESLGTRLRIADGHECFSLGMFSLLDVLLGKTMEDALSDVALPDSVEASLKGEPGPLSDLLGVVIAYERGQWDVVSQLAAKHGWSEAELIGLYIEAIEWSRDFFGTGV